MERNLLLPAEPLRSLDEYLARGGGEGLAAARRQGTEWVLDEVDRAGVRGRGGAGFPSARKWRSVRAGGPEVGDLTPQQATSTTASVSWASSTGTVAQVEFGTTANYGSFTLLKVFAAPAQEMVLTGLRPATDYHVRVKAWDGDGSLGSSGDAVFTTASAGAATAPVARTPP